MKDTEFYNLNFDDIDYDSPLTDDELDYLDIIGVDRIDPVIDQVCEELPSDEKLLEICEKELDIFDAPAVQLVNISDLEISGNI